MGPPFQAGDVMDGWKDTKKTSSNGWVFHCICHVSFGVVYFFCVFNLAKYITILVEVVVSSGGRREVNIGAWVI